MNRAATIRAYLREHASEEEPRWPCEIAGAIPCPEGTDERKHGLQVSWTLNIGVRDGFIGRKVEGGGRYRYWLIRDPVVRTALDKEASRQRRREKERARQMRKAREKGIRPIAEVLAERAARKAANKAAERERRRQREEDKNRAAAERRRQEALDRAQAAVKRLREQPKAEPRALSAPKSASATRPAAQQPSVIRMAPSPKPAPAVRVESVEEFLARGGKVQSLPVGAVSKPVLRFPPIDFRKQAA